jgi:hypothetical protein
MTHAKARRGRFQGLAYIITCSEFEKNVRAPRKGSRTPLPVFLPSTGMKFCPIFLISFSL